jgi:uncharacterized protein YggT (Ycf19 family)
VRGLLAERRGGSLSRGVRLTFLVIEMFLVAIVMVLAAAFLLSFLGANPDAAFAQWVYARTDAIMTPFNGLFSPLSLSDSMNINVSLLFAIFVYSMIAYVIDRFARRV